MSTNAQSGMQGVEETELKGSDLHKYCSRHSVVFSTLPIGEDKQQKLSNIVMHKRALGQNMRCRTVLTHFWRHLRMAAELAGQKECAHMTATKCQAFLCRQVSARLSVCPLLRSR